MNSRNPVLALLTAGALGLAACGSSGYDGKLDRAALAKKADAICLDGGKKAAAVQAPADFGQADSDPSAAAAYLGKLYPITKAEYDQHAALKADDDAKADWDAFLAAESKLVDSVKSLRDKAIAHDKSGLADLANSDALSKPYQAAADKIGAASCKTA